MSDENMHAVGNDPAWSESYYFNFIDPVSKIGAFTRMGFRPGSGWADALHAVYLPGKRVAFTYGRRQIEGDLSRYNEDLVAGNLALTCIEPHQSWQIAYHGPAQDIADSSILLQRSKRRPPGWFKPASLDMELSFDCLTDAHYAAAGARGHFEQSGRVIGSIKLADEIWSVDGYGVRDKSWGPRDWGAGNSQNQTESVPKQGPAPFVNWFSMNFGEYAAMGGACSRQADGTMLGSGWMQREGQFSELTNVTIETDYQDSSILHTAVRLYAVTESGSNIEISGTVLNVCPTKIAMPGGATFVNEGLTEFTWGDRTGYGIAEHWHRLTL